MSEPAPRKRKARAVTLALQIGVSVALVAALVFVVDWQGLRQAAAALSIGGVIGVVLLNFLAQASLIWRWRALLATVGVHESFGRSWRTVFAGLFLNNFMPGTLGLDGLRILLMGRACGSMAVAIGAIAYERAMQVSIYVLLIVFASLWPMGWLAPWLHLTIVATGGFAVLALLLLLKWLSGRRISGAPAGAGLLLRGWSFLGAMLAETGRMQVRLRHHRGAQAQFFISSLFNVGCVLALFAVALHDLGRPVDLPVIVFAVGIAAIVSGLPISFGGIGVYEAALVLLLGLGGVPSGDALLVALVVRGASIAVTLLGLPSALLMWRERASQMG
ncbi:MAG TPA: lysylphosphatidylglycerol synthase transmembrane domain-containing protein [Dongiaceae bacterium]|nr:lysylphosphatidylglycerol synthase transmembrane domain-containing protein [Dongiaceae bacterium]